MDNKCLDNISSSLWGGGGGAAVETGEIGNKGADEGAEIEQERETRMK